MCLTEITKYFEVKLLISRSSNASYEGVAEPVAHELCKNCVNILDSHIEKLIKQFSKPFSEVTQMLEPPPLTYINECVPTIDLSVNKD